MLTKQKVC